MIGFFNPFARLRREAEQARAEKRVARDQYLSLMQDCLTNRHYEDPPLKTFGDRPYDEMVRERGMDWPSTAHTMIGTARMANLRGLVETVIEERIPGDLLEAGVWRGGACIFMRSILKAYEESGRRVWVADSFEGLPPPDTARYPADAGQTFHEYAELAVPLEEVQRNFSRYGLLDDQVAFLKGWFKDTLPDAPIEKLAILRVDGDLYESTSDTLSNLYGKLSIGGFVIIDDYGVVDACRKATDDFRAANGIVDPLQAIDGVGVYWRKSGGIDYPAATPDHENRPAVIERPASLWGGFYWENDERLLIRDVAFLVTCDMDKLMGTSSTEDHFVLGKARSMVEDSIALSRRRKIGKIFEIGIFKGGSMILNDLVFAPSRIAAVDFNPAPVEAMTRYIEKTGKSDVIRPYYGIDQSDRQAMEKVLSGEFPDRDIDMIVDDASHLYEQTRAAFNISFPYLRPGGLYIIEDWGWAHWSGDFWQKDNPYFGARPAMSNLLIELFMLAASRPDLIESVEVVCSVITVKKGQGKMPEGDFDLGEHYLMRGKPFTAPL
ncbi:MAG: hypothetical protein COW18_00055 [Zetaproteobacteria bacterium CG12_big_fil_rev_8_21_14_0_65_54_13]|nr:MAG: hypothetical protein COX55_07095 [Zetaproteobacteria bacterium CG23_combo_of_CG06-09_8_20_14_all_54_7]PIW51598.1 MAG: hypothetical protein COW18_00055 [Zetaproteobacteria bacterium CG12_big_fil_rev_8_21_14_0_65_54_13]PIX55443.1 MAG: hypothetical protein COZ50_02765 [Zetaproteobacteria bacterium CG_4_10_14_3_um_filter_54_28]